jgi:uncharacterized damage-inducible protein DinB
MSFANPAQNASAAAASYVSALMELLGDKEPLSVQRQLLTSVHQVVDAMSSNELQQPEAPGKWSVHDIVRHLMHTEMVYAYRYRVTVAQDRPNIPGFDQDAWSTMLKSDGNDLTQNLARLSMLRSWNLEFLESRSADELQDEGKHEERGWESLAHQIKLGAAHDLVHRRQLLRVREMVTSGNER